MSKPDHYSPFTLKINSKGIGQAVLLLLISFATSWWWTLQEARKEVELIGQTLQPVLTSSYPERGENRFEGIPSGVRVSLFRNDQETLLAPGPNPDFSLQEFPTRQSPGEAFLQKNVLNYLFSVHSTGEEPATVLISLPLEQRRSTFLGRGAFLFLISLFVLMNQKRIKDQEAQPRIQLENELQAIRTDRFDRTIRLPFGHTFTGVANTINQLLSSTERKDRQLNEQHHQQQVLLKNMSEGILTLDNDQRITGCNPEAARWLNLGNAQRIRGELIYTCCRIPALLSMIEKVGTTGLQEEYLRLERTDSEDRIVKVKGSPLIDQDQTMGVLFVLQDVTTLRRLETLRQDFVSNVSHELKTPLTAIKGYAELMFDAPDTPDDTKKHLERILKQSSRMIHIIEDLLSLTRIENTKESPSLVHTELRPIFESVMHLCEEPKSLRDLSFEVACDDKLAADLHPALFEQAVHNLVYNAVKYTNPGTTIFLRATPVDSGIRIEIEDQGPGIPQNDQARIFERFYRVDKARSRAVGGTGLGLSIVKHITLMHGGSVGVESELGRGTTFWIELPQAEG